MGLGTGRGRVAPGDAPWKGRAHEPSPPRFTLVRGETLIALVPDDENSAWSLVVTREGPGRLRLEPREKARALIADAPRASSREVYGCAGAIRTPSGVHLLVISGCKSVGAVRGCPVFRAAAFDAAPCAGAGRVPGALARGATRRAGPPRAASEGARPEGDASVFLRRPGAIRLHALARARGDAGGSSGSDARRARTGRRVCENAVVRRRPRLRVERSVRRRVFVGDRSKFY